jgi:hypothetical protein
MRRLGPALLLCASCAPAPEPSSASTVSSTEVAGTRAVPAKPCADAPPEHDATDASAGACVVRAPNGVLRDVWVGDFAVTVTRAPLEIRLTTTAGKPSKVHVAGAFAFDGWATVESLALTKATELVPRMVRGGAGTRVDAPHAEGNRAVGAARVGEVEITPAGAACGAFTTPALEPDRRDVHARFIVMDRFRPREESLVLHQAPDSPLAVRLTGYVEVGKLAEKSAWMRVGTEFLDGSTISGWTKADALEKILPGQGGGAHGHGGPALCGDGCAGGDGSSPHFEGKALIAAGTKVHTAPSGTVWATVSRAASFDVIQREANGWVEITSAPGIEEERGCRTLRHAFVEASAVRVPR